MPKVEWTQEWVLARCDQQPDGCWWWTRSRNRQGYGKVAIGPNHKRSTTGAHRVSYEVFVGPIPEGLMVLHRCDVPQCVNPAHLFVGTAADNMHDAMNKGRHVPPPRTIPNGTWRRNPRTKLTEDQVREIHQLKGQMSQRRLAVKFGVSKSTIGFIHNGKRWTTLGPEATAL